MNTEITPISYRITDAARVLGIGRSSIFKLLKEGKLRRVRIGTLVLIPRDSLEALLGEADDA